MAWPVLGPIIARLYRRCLETGWHPKPFRTAVICVLDKPGERDRTSPRSYRLISLLSVLGKGLERIVARRLAWVAVTAKIVPAAYFSAVPLRSATDQATILMDDIERARKNRKVLSALSLDIKGAFDAVLPGRMIQRLYDQGWPYHVVQWVATFLTDRNAAITLPGFTQEQTPTAGSLPQGSPVSPILFMLFLQPLLAARGSGHGSLRRRGYADDILLTAVGLTPNENVLALEIDLRECLQWCRTNGLDVDRKKTGLIHFTGRRRFPHAAIQNPPWEGTIEPEKAIKWLGVLWDSQLSFREHLATALRKGQTAANALRVLGGCRKGASPRLLLTVARATVLPTMAFASEAWWWPPGSRRSRMAGAIKKMDLAWRTALKAALPLYRTTPNELVHHAAGLPPFVHHLDHLARRHALRIHRLDPAHPLRKRLRTTDRYPETRLAYTKALLPATPEEVNPLAVPPWHEPPVPDATDTALSFGAHGVTKAAKAAAFVQWQRTLPPRDWVLFTDGSKLENGNTGAGWTIVHGANTLASGAFACGAHAEVLDAEAAALHAGLQAAAELAGIGAPSDQPAARHAGNLWACLDNQGVIRRVLNPTATSLTSQAAVRESADILQAWERREGPTTRYATLAATASLRWVPGHAGVPGNEEADRLAGFAAATLQPLNPRMTVAGGRRWAATQLRTGYRSWWSNATHRGIIPLPNPKYAPPPAVSRSVLARILAARSGHGDFAAYHERFNHHDAQIHCRCGARKTPLHFFSCRKAPERHRLKYYKNQPMTLEDLLTTAHGAMCMADWLKSTNFFAL